MNFMNQVMTAFTCMLFAAAGPSDPGGALRVTVSAPWAPVARGAPVELTLEVTNTSDRPVTLHFNTSQRYDFLIHDAAGKEMWTWAQERMFLQVLGQEDLQPGATKTYKERFLGTLSPGTYRVTGRLAARETTPPATATFVIE